MAILNPSFELGTGVPTDWTISSLSGGYVYADFTTFGGGIESYYYGWPTENHIADWSLVVAPSIAMFDGGMRAYETWWFVYIEEWASAGPDPAMFDSGDDSFEGYEWFDHYAAWSDVTSDVAMFGITLAYESYEGIHWTTLPASAAAMFDAGAHAYESYETW